MAFVSAISSTKTNGKPKGDIHRFVEQGFRALQSGDRQRATDICQRALQQRPDMARAHYLAALLAIDGGEHDIAVKALRRTVELNEQHAPAWAQLARSFVLNGEFGKAEGCLENAVNTEKGNPVVHDLIGTAFRLAGNLERARHWHEKAVTGAPSHVPFLINLANVYLYFGDSEEADRLLSQCVDIDPGNAQVHWLLARTSTAKSVWHIEAMQDLVASQRDARSLSYLNYAIGKEAEDLEDWSLAFDAFAAGAEARRQTVAFDEPHDTAVFDAAERLFTRAWLDEREPGLSDAAPIFIVGEPRSGTTLLDRMLGAHDKVNSAGELRHMGFAIRHISGVDERRQFSPKLLDAAATADTFQVGTAYFESTASLRGESAHLIDKLPVNYLYLPIILAALPKAKILHLQRDPMDACFSMYKQLFADAYLYTYDQAELARHYVRYSSLMSVWRKRFPDRFLDVSYEELVQSTEATLRSVLEHVDLSWQDQCLEFASSTTAVTTASAAQVRQKPHARSIGRWRQYEKGLRPMREILSAAGVV
ncbi:MAG: tetratricopeptide repeat-containing sulfotransferase family protein [Woeseiaceae bacterium]